MAPVQRHHPAASFPTTSSSPPQPPHHLYTSAVSTHHASIGSSQETDLTPNSGMTPWSHVVWNNVEELSLDGDSRRKGADEFSSSWQEEAHWMSFRHAVQQFAALKILNSSKIMEEPEVEEETASSQNSKPSAIPQGKKRSKSPTLEADLAETKMRLALAQAERDELEYALLQRGDGRTGSGTTTDST